MERERILRKIVIVPELVHPVARMREIPPITVANEKPIIGRGGEQKLRELPLSAQEQQRENNCEQSREKRVAPPTAHFSEPMHNQVQSKRWHDEKKWKGGRSHVREWIINRSQLWLTMKQRQNPSHQKRQRHVNAGHNRGRPAHF